MRFSDELEQWLRSDGPKTLGELGRVFEDRGVWFLVAENRRINQDLIIAPDGRKVGRTAAQSGQVVVAPATARATRLRTGTSPRAVVHLEPVRLPVGTSASAAGHLPLALREQLVLGIHSFGGASIGTLGAALPLPGFGGSGDGAGGGTTGAGDFGATGCSLGCELIDSCCGCS